MEELIVYALLAYMGLPEAEAQYNKKLDELFLQEPESEALRHLECETNVEETMIFIWNHIDWSRLDRDVFGKHLMKALKAYYEQCSDIRKFAGKLPSLWNMLPDDFQDAEPFWTLNYADEPLCWDDEEQTRDICEKMLNYYA